jgi:hypothetical protein
VTREVSKLKMDGRKDLFFFFIFFLPSLPGRPIVYLEHREKPKGDSRHIDACYRVYHQPKAPFA